MWVQVGLEPQSLLLLFCAPPMRGPGKRGEVGAESTAGAGQGRLLMGVGEGKAVGRRSLLCQEQIHDFLEEGAMRSLCVHC